MREGSGSIPDVSILFFTGNRKWHALWAPSGRSPRHLLCNTKVRKRGREGYFPGPEARVRSNLHVDSRSNASLVNYCGGQPLEPPGHLIHCGVILTKTSRLPLHLPTFPLLFLDNYLRWNGMSRVQLQNIPALTFYKDSLTAARRVDAVPQLTCIGKPCRVYQPEAIRCTNIGGSGNNVDWKVRSAIPIGRRRLIALNASVRITVRSRSAFVFETWTS